jgi:hypothetical protein
MPITPKKRFRLEVPAQNGLRNKKYHLPILFLNKNYTFNRTSAGDIGAFNYTCRLI